MQHICLFAYIHTAVQDLHNVRKLSLGEAESTERFRAKYGAETKKSRCAFIKAQDTCMQIVSDADNVQHAKAFCFLAQDDVIINKASHFHQSGWPCVNNTGFSYQQRDYAKDVVEDKGEPGEGVNAVVRAVEKDETVGVAGENVTTG